MAKKYYIGVNGVARQIVAPYEGNNGIAREIKKGYIGTDGVARLFFEGENGKLFLFNNTDNTSVTGGWQRITYLYRSSASFTANENMLKVVLPTHASAGSVNGSTINTIDISKYTKFYIEGTYTRSSSSHNGVIMTGIKTAESETNPESMMCYTSFLANGASGTFSFYADISSMNGLQQPIIAITEPWGSVSFIVEITKAWLE